MKKAGPGAAASRRGERKREREREKEKRREGAHPGRVVSRCQSRRGHMSQLFLFFLHLKRIDVIDPRFTTPISTRSGKNWKVL